MIYLNGNKKVLRKIGNPRSPISSSFQEDYLRSRYYKTTLLCWFVPSLQSLQKSSFHGKNIKTYVLRTISIFTAILYRTSLLRRITEMVKYGLDMVREKLR